MRKAFDTDIETIKALRTAAAAASASSNPTSITTTMPQFSYVPFTYEIEQTFMHIGVDELEVVVERAWQLGVVNGPGTREGWPKSADDTNSFVVVDLGWPLVDDGKVEGVGSNADSKFETGVVKLNANPGKEARGGRGGIWFISLSHFSQTLLPPPSIPTTRISLHQKT